MMLVDKLMALYSDIHYSVFYTRAKVTKTCILCRGSADSFKNTEGKLEYQISALCEKCQDEVFKNVPVIPLRF